MKQHEAVIETLERLGGIATLGELNKEVFKIKDCKWRTKTPFASIRRIVQVTKGIYKIRPGLYGLEKYRKQIEDKGMIVETEHNKNSDDINTFNHSYYQGILLLIGKYRKMQTAGSSTTGIAASLTGRRFLGIEQDSGFLALSKARREEINDNGLRMTYCGKIKDMAYIPSQQIVCEDFQNDYGLPF